MNQVHKETLSQIDNALPNRANLDVEIFGMEGIPEDIVQAHQQRVLQQFAQTEADRRAASGQPGPGGGSGSASKKPKFETPSEMKKRLAEHKARKAADEAAATANPVPAPVEANGAQASGYAHGPTPGFVSRCTPSDSIFADYTVWRPSLPSTANAFPAVTLWCFSKSECLWGFASSIHAFCRPIPIVSVSIPPSGSRLQCSSLNTIRPAFVLSSPSAISSAGVPASTIST
jgi:hypothetical protein